MENYILNPKEAALHVLTALREDVGAIPKWAIPKYPLPAIMRTEDQLKVMHEFAEEAGCDEGCLGTTNGELEDLLRKARLLRARFLVRKLRKGDGDCIESQKLAELVAEGYVSLEDMRVKEDAFIRILQACN